MSFEPENDPYHNQGVVPLGKEDESALNDLNSMLQMQLQLIKRMSRNYHRVN